MSSYRHDLTGFVDFLGEWLPRYALEGTGRYARHLHRADVEAGVPDAYGCADAAGILYMLGALPAGADERAAWVESLRSFQDPTSGVFADRTHSDLHTTAQVTAALELFDARPAHPLAVLAPVLEPAAVAGFLDGLDWDHPWPSSHDGAGAAAALAITGEAGPAWFDAYFAWLDAEADAATGLWRRGRMLPAQEWPGLFSNLGGSFHYHFLYDYFRRPWPHPERVLETCLTLLHDSAAAIAETSVGFAEIDLVYCLSRARRQTDVHFRAAGEALELLADRVAALLGDPGYLGSDATDDVHVTFGAVCTVAELQRALPGSIATPVPLRLVLDRRPFI
ncbi:hypothetical protein ACFFOM_05530 [Microlunatus capsulatus]|uniref:Uncharacterized protein n=1 Tax=Microlunatus capsulatus TaxID=99117 RepID=A0ABS4Z558_9ACTN|nr:hypothetical protein [Microlunatus capsulatus]MBP2416176.1 hypothetical protein [Microlunatus capsulatus]